MKAKICDDRRFEYKKLFELGLIMSLVLHIFFLQSFKKMNLHFTQRWTDISTPELVDIPVTEQKKKITPPKRPSVPIISESKKIPPEVTLDPREWIPDENFSPPVPKIEKDKTPLFVPYDKPPVPVGGYAAISKNLIYPEIARKAGIEGRVTIAAQIDEKGNVVAIRVLESLGPNGCDEAAANAIRAVKWNPALQRDKKIKVWISIPIHFKLTGV